MCIRGSISSFVNSLCRELKSVLFGIRSSLLNVEEANSKFQVKICEKIDSIEAEIKAISEMRNEERDKFDKLNEALDKLAKLTESLAESNKKQQDALE